jgi:hypothetical protein
MAGLLDGFGDFVKSPEGQGLLSAVMGGLAGAKQGTPWNNLGRAGLSGISGYSTAVDNQTKLAEANQMNAFRQAQISNYNSEVAQRDAEAKLKKSKAEALPLIFTGGQQALAPLAGDSSIGILPSAGRPAVAPQIDYQRAIAAGYTPKEVKDLADLKDINLNKVARTIKGVGPDGKEYEYQVDEMGRKVGDGFAQYKAPLMQDLGGNVSALDPYTLVPRATLPKTMTFGDKAAFENLGVSRERLAFDKENQNQPKYNEGVGGFIAPPSKANPNGLVIPLSGGNGTPKLTEDQAKASGWLVQATNAFNNMSSAIKSNPSSNKTGFNDAIAGIPIVGEPVANMMRGDDRQKYIQGASSLSEALLRAATGAGVNRDEAIQKVRELTPQIGDSDAVIKQKQDAIPLYIKTLEMRAGAGAKNLPSIMQSTQKLPGMNLPMDYGSNNSDPLGLFKR